MSVKNEIIDVKDLELERIIGFNGEFTCLNAHHSNAVVYPRAIPPI